MITCFVLILISKNDKSELNLKHTIISLGHLRPCSLPAGNCRSILYLTHKNRIQVKRLKLELINTNLRRYIPA